MSEGWIKLNRSILDSKIWDSNEPFDMRSAWIDLILMANYEDKTLITRHKTVIQVKRGSLFTSVQHLADRWKWSPGRVKRFIKLLKTLEMVTADGLADGTLVTLVNYSKYQDWRRADGLADGLSDGPADGPADGPRLKKEKEYKEGKNARAAHPHHKTLAEKLAAIEERRQRLEREEQEAAEREREKKTDD